AAFKNWEEVRDLRNTSGTRQGIPEQVQRRELFRRIIVKVIQENRLDLLIQLHSPLPPGKIGLAPEPEVNNRGLSYAFGPNAGVTEILIPAGYVQTAYDASFVLETDRNGRKYYGSRPGSTPTPLAAPGLPFSINFMAEPGMEPLIIKAATAYQAASKRRVSPPAFGPLPGEP
ncbi:MAG: hypothetical protein AB7I13_09720, partial [Vicinamibacterales bacterium]